MKKRLWIVLVLTLAVISGIIVINNKDTAKAEDSFYLKMNEQCENLPEGFFDNQREANEITDKFFKSLSRKNGWTEDPAAYTVNGLYADAFPLYYAGTYINVEGKLVLQITEDYYSENYKESEWYSEFIEIVGNENFYCNPVTYSYSTLINAMTDIVMGDIHNDFQDAGVIITGAGINDYKNQIDVYVKTQKDYDYAIDRLDSELYSVEIMDCVLKNCTSVNHGEESEITEEMNNNSQEKKRISNMTDEELKAFLSEYTKGYNYKNDSEKELMLRYMKALIVQFDTPGKTYSPYSHALYLAFEEEIDEGVREYYGVYDYTRSDDLVIDD